MVKKEEIEHLYTQLHLKDLELKSLLEVTQAINANMPEEALYKIYHFTLISNLDIKKLALYVFDEQWECKVNYGTKKNFKKEPLAPHILEINEYTTLEHDKVYSEFNIVIPIKHKSIKLAYVLANTATKKAPEELSFLQTFTNVIIVAIENKKLARKELARLALRKELEIAREVQAMLFPKSLPNNQAISVKASYYPHDSIGGDYYDYIPLCNDECIVCIADVSGKGIPAALLMANFQASLRTLVRHNTDPVSIVHELNQTIMNVANGERFITFFIALINTRKKTIQYINAGHNPPVLFNDGHTSILEKGTTVLGAFNKLPFVNTETIQYTPDAMLLLYTDGITELVNEDGAEYGIDNLKNFCSTLKGLSDQELHAAILKEINTYKGKNPYTDDVTYVSCILK